MRTFHTGGVFSGDLTRQIRSPLSGTVFYELRSNTILVRTMHGEKGFKLLENVNIFIKDKKQAVVSLDIPKGNILLVNNTQKMPLSNSKLRNFGNEGLEIVHRSLKILFVLFFS